MTTFMPLSSKPKENEQMPPKTQSPWKQYLTPGILSASIVGGIPYIDSLQSKLNDARVSTARLEVKVESLSEDVKSMKATIESIRSRLESRGIVHRTENVVGEVAGENHTSK